jgi:hypothetical protein
MRKLLCKLFIIILFLITAIVPVYSFEIYDLNGNWLDHYMMQWYSKRGNPRNPEGGYFPIFLREHSWGDGMAWNQTTTVIQIYPKQDSEYNGRYLDPSNGFEIRALGKLNNNEFEFYLASNREHPGLKSLIHFYDEDTISISVEGWDDFGTSWGKNKIWHRFSGPAKIPVQEAVINNTGVRLRTRPNLSSDTWTYLNTGDAIKILDRSPEKMKIDDMEDYWYRIRLDKRPEGWVYGAYVDILEPKRASD